MGVHPDARVWLEVLAYINYRNNNAGAGEGTQKVKEFVEQARVPKFSLSKLAKSRVLSHAFL